jgi:hypothetical protein
MRAFVRVLPLLAVAALLAACATTNLATGYPGAKRYAAAAKLTQRPDQALLARQPPPQCERSKPLEGVPADQARAASLDYEQQCYRQLAEMQHARLAALQDAAGKTRSFASAHRALLEPQPSPQCEPAKPAAGLSPTEAHEATLDAQRQCYKQLEAGERQKLGALQDALHTSLHAAPGRSGGARRVRRTQYIAY